MTLLKSTGCLLLALAIFFGLSLRIEGRKLKSRFTNFRCESYNNSYCSFEKCKLNLLGRGRVGAYMYLKLFQVPVENAWINWGIYRRYNGYRPFLYNISTDLCQLLKNTQIKSFEGLVMGAIMTKSNLNHTCPYDHDIILDNLEFTDAFLKSLPLPQGEYLLQLRFATYKVWRVQVSAFFVKEGTE
ncbi:hypothetical protein KR018_011281 [Drosophila ironensis]|nr:hypothetical protein KR018_011281 [Drosophila ironensis]